MNVLSKFQNLSIGLPRGLPLLAIYSSTRSLQSTGKRGFRDGTDTHTTHGHCDLETESAQWADFEKIVKFLRHSELATAGGLSHR